MLRKSLKLVSVAGLTGFCLLMLLSACGELGGPPLDVRLGTDVTGLKVLITWNMPRENVPDKYRLYFSPLPCTSLRQIAETTATSYLHDPKETTGVYVVAAVFGTKEYYSESLRTIPVYNDTVTLAELDASGNDAYGWNLRTGFGRTCSMHELGNTRLADFFVTDFRVGSSRLPYALASPHMGPADPSGLVPTSDAWRRSKFTDPLASEQSPLPVWSDTTYFDWTYIAPLPATIGCRTQDGHFALVKVISVDAGAGDVRLVSWFQLVPGLRLMMHPTE